MKEIAVVESEEILRKLKTLSREINDLYTSAESKAKKAFDFACEAVKDAILCGHKLNEAKRSIPHGHWIDWVEKNCPEVSLQKAERFMRLSNSSHVMNLGSCATLRQAYIACGILPTPEPTTPSEQTPLTFERLLQWAGFAQKVAPELLTALSMDDKERDQLKERLRPAHEAYLALTKN